MGVLLGWEFCSGGIYTGCGLAKQVAGNQAELTI
jgi:hypothetical protein